MRKPKSDEALGYVTRGGPGEIWLYPTAWLAVRKAAAVGSRLVVSTPWADHLVYPPLSCGALFEKGVLSYEILLSQLQEEEKGRDLILAVYSAMRGEKP